MTEAEPEALAAILVREVRAWRLSEVLPAAAPEEAVPERRAEPVVVEATVTVVVNGKPLVRFQCLPARLEDLALGFLLDEGLIDAPEQVKSVVAAGSEVQVEADVEFERLVKFFDSITAVSGCGRGGSTAGAGSPATVTSKARFQPGACLAMMRVLERASTLFRRTGGVHLAALSRGGGLLEVAEDIGRHNAVDKVIGAWVRAARAAGGTPRWGELVLLTTGRLSSDIASKAARVGLPLVVSRSAPTTAAVELAREAGLCLVGFARGRRLNVYSAAWRLGISTEGAASDGEG